jgi:imidazolonepropionase-like amidohydrolase
MQAILAGTRDNAVAMRVSDITGTIETGKAADLLLVEGNPVEDIAALRRVLGVFHEGSWAAGSKLPEA